MEPVNPADRRFRGAAGSGIRSELRATLALAAPLAAANLAQMAMGVTDMVMVGGLGALPLAAAGLGAMLYFTGGVVLQGILSAVAPLTAHALGAGASLLLRGSADPMNPKALRAAMGATFRHPVVQLDDGPFIAWARERGIRLWAAAADGVPLARALDSRTSRQELIAVIVGNEGAGIRPQLNAIAAQRVAIPLARGAESLNVAVAAGILLYEVLRGH